MKRTEEYKFMKEAFKDIPRHKVATNNGGFIMTLFYTKYNFERYCLRFSEIENYELASADNFNGWHCHHRLEKDYTREELIKNNLYFNRPPEELIFLTRENHQKIHSEYNTEKGFYPAKGHHWNMPEDFCKKKSELLKNLIWVNNGVINKRVLQNHIPDGFVKGKIKGGKSKLKGRKWYINAEGKRYWK